MKKANAAFPRLHFVIDNKLESHSSGCIVWNEMGYVSLLFYVTSEDFIL